jgi:ketosteroid isomerase-like protein
MINFRMLTCCILLFCFPYGCATRSMAVNRAEDERAVREIEAEISRALAARDLDHMMALYAEGAALYYEDRPMIGGKDAIHEVWKSLHARPGFGMSTELLNVEISGRSDLGFTRGSYSMTMNDANGAPTAGTGEYVLVYGKQSDGKWKIIAENGDGSLRIHSLPKSPDRRQQPASQIAPLIGLAGLFSGMGFLFGMPVIAAAFAWKYYRSRKLPTGLSVAIVMILVFWVAATQLWRYVTAHYWNMSFMTALEAAGDAARFGHPIEHTAEVLVVDLVIFSTLLAFAAGAITFAVCRLRMSHSRRRA